MPSIQLKSRQKIFYIFFNHVYNKIYFQYLNPLPVRLSHLSEAYAGLSTIFVSIPWTP